METEEQTEDQTLICPACGGDITCIQDRTVYCAGIWHKACAEADFRDRRLCSIGDAIRDLED